MDTEYVNCSWNLENNFLLPIGSLGPIWELISAITLSIYIYYVFWDEDPWWTSFNQQNHIAYSEHLIPCFLDFFHIDTLMRQLFKLLPFAFPNRWGSLANFHTLLFGHYGTSLTNSVGPFIFTSNSYCYSPNLANLHDLFLSSLCSLRLFLKRVCIYFSMPPSKSVYCSTPTAGASLRNSPL